MAWKRADLSSAAPWITFLAGLAVLAVVLASFRSGARTTDELRLSAILDAIVFGVEEQAEAHWSLLRATHAFVETSEGPVSLDAFRNYVSRLRLRGRYLGIEGIAYVPRVAAGDVAETQQTLAQFYGANFVIWPKEGQEVFYPIVYIEPLDSRNRAALGYDLSSEPERRAALEQATRTDDQAISGPITLRQDVGLRDPGPGFIVAQAVKRPEGKSERPLAGFVSAAFRANDFFAAAITPGSWRLVTIEVFDGRPDDGTLLYSSTGKRTTDDTSRSLAKVPAIGNRLWTIRVTPTAALTADSASTQLPLVALLGVLLAAVLGLLSWQQSRRQLAARREAERMRVASEEKDLLLQEMKHRIKNVIARVQAIARQTVRNASGLDDFEASYDARLSAMAKTYDLLTRSQWSGAELGDVLKSELLTITGRTEVDFKTAGPPVHLAPREVLALGLVFHELATNALKYGGLSREGGSLSIDWEVTGPPKGERLRLTWDELSPGKIEHPGEAGFGSRLIDTAVTRELNGTIERTFRVDGLTVVIVFPLAVAKAG